MISEEAKTKFFISMHFGKKLVLRVLFVPASQCKHSVIGPFWLVVLACVVSIFAGCCWWVCVTRGDVRGFLWHCIGWGWGWMVRMANWSEQFRGKVDEIFNNHCLSNLQYCFREKWNFYWWTRKAGFQLNIIIGTLTLKAIRKFLEIPMHKTFPRKLTNHLCFHVFPTWSDCYQLAYNRNAILNFYSFKLYYLRGRKIPQKKKPQRHFTCLSFTGLSNKKASFSIAPQNRSERIHLHFPICLSGLATAGKAKSAATSQKRGKKGWSVWSASAPTFSRIVLFGSAGNWRVLSAEKASSWQLPTAAGLDDERAFTVQLFCGFGLVVCPGTVGKVKVWHRLVPLEIWTRKGTTFPKIWIFQ